MVPRTSCVAAALAVVLCCSSAARAQEGSAELEPGELPASASTPPPLHVTYLQYGVGFTGEFVTTPGPMCPSQAAQPCILGSGGGVAVRVGWRSAGPLYLGGAYELSKQEA